MHYGEQSLSTGGEEITAVVLGSFRYYPDMLASIEAFEENGIPVLMPRKGAVSRVDETGFIFLDSDGDKTAAEVQTEFCDAIATASLAYIVAPDGYFGETVSYEMGRVAAARIPAFSSGPINTADRLIPGDRGGLLGSMLSRIRVALPEQIAAEKLYLNSRIACLQWWVKSEV